MKKVIISSVVALALAFTATLTVGASYTFSNYLTVGSTGADVTALQSWLVSNGFLSMPAGVSMGYFGSLTKAAVIKYQASAGIVPQSGFVGPLTIAKLNGAPAAMTTTSTFTCPVGWSCQAPATVNTTTTTVNQNLTGITTPGVAGSLTIAKGSFTGNGTVVNDGQAVDVASYDLQAGASDEQVSALSFDFNVRPWLYVNSYSLYNAATGATLATVSGLTQANFTELTVGSDYRLTIPGVNLVVPAGKKITVVLHAQFGVSNRTGLSIYTSRAEVRAVDGTGVTITQNIGTGIAPDGGLATYVAYGGQNNSNLVVTIDPSSPNTGIVQTNTAPTQTQNVLLGVFDFKSQNINSTLQGLTINLNTSGAFSSVGGTFANVQLKTGSTLLTSGTISTPAASTSAVVFTNFNLALPTNTYVPVSVYVTVNGGVNGILVSTSLALSTSNVIGIDANSNALTLSSNATLPSANQTFILSGVNLSNLTWTISPAPAGTGGALSKTSSFNGSFTVTAGSNPIYISTAVGTAFATTTNATTSTMVSAIVTNFVPSNGVQSYDSVGSYYQITPGSSRTFTVNGTQTNNAGVSQSIGTGISTIYFGSATSALQALPISFLLQGLNSDNHIQTLLGTN